MLWIYLLLAIATRDEGSGRAETLRKKHTLDQEKEEKQKNILD